MNISGSCEVGAVGGNEILFSICTLVSDEQQYVEMCASFLGAGFSEDSCEFIYADNREENQYDAYEGLNLCISRSRGKYVILCHQDILLEYDNRSILERRLKELDALDPSWAVAGNAGGSSLIGTVYRRISDPHGEDSSCGSFPCMVAALDENFMVIKKDANMGLSRDMGGFHFYGTDICILARVRGYSCYVIDFHIRHLSGGNKDEHFYQVRRKFIRKYQYAFSGRFVQTACTPLYIGGVWFFSGILNNRFLLSKYRIVKGRLMRLLSWFRGGQLVL